MLEIIEKDFNGVYTEKNLYPGSIIMSDKSFVYTIGLDVSGNKCLLVISNERRWNNNTVVYTAIRTLEEVLYKLNHDAEYRLYTPNQVKMTLEVG